MIFNSRLTFDQQPSSDINEDQTNILRVSTSGGELVSLTVSGVVMGVKNGQSGDIVTILTGDECQALIALLQAACEAAEQGVIAA